MMLSLPASSSASCSFFVRDITWVSRILVKQIKIVCVCVCYGIKKDGCGCPYWIE